MTLSALCVFGFFIGSMADTVWRAVDVDTNKLKSGISITTTTAPSLRKCGTLCDQRPTCFSWRFQNKVCNVTNLMVSPLHIATTNDTVKFYTYLEKDFAFGSKVTAHKYYSHSLPSNLAKGIYNKDQQGTCFYAGNTAGVNPWVLIQLQSPKKISTVRITPQPGSAADIKPYGAEIRVGSASPETKGDFSSYKLIGKLPDPIDDRKTYTVDVFGGITGQFISIQKKVDADRIAICYIVIL